MDDDALLTAIATGDDQALRTLHWELTNASVGLSGMAGSPSGSFLSP